MERDQNSEELFRRYLLGMLEQEEEYRLEERLLSDTEYFDELLMAEDELVDDYIDGELSERAREKFEHHFLSTFERQQKLSFAKALKRHVAVAEVTRPLHAGEAPPRLTFRQRLMRVCLGAKSPLLVFSFAFLLIIILGGSWLVVRNLRLRSPGEHGAAANAIVVDLSSGILRGAGEIKRITIAPGVSTVRLRLEMVRDEYQSYHAAVEAEEGAEVFVARKLKPEATAGGRTVAFDLPARLLSSGDFQVKLSGVSAGDELESIGKYYFRVVPAASQPQQP